MVEGRARQFAIFEPRRIENTASQGIYVQATEKPKASSAYLHGFSGAGHLS
jgi:hypothetical protein